MTNPHQPHAQTQRHRSRFLGRPSDYFFVRSVKQIKLFVLALAIGNLLHAFAFRTLFPELPTTLVPLDVLYSAVLLIYYLTLKNHHQVNRFSQLFVFYTIIWLLIVLVLFIYLISNGALYFFYCAIIFLILFCHLSYWMMVVFQIFTACVISTFLAMVYGNVFLPSLEHLLIITSAIFGSLILNVLNNNVARIRARQNARVVQAVENRMKGLLADQTTIADALVQESKLLPTASQRRELYGLALQMRILHTLFTQEIQQIRHQYKNIKVFNGENPRLMSSILSECVEIFNSAVAVQLGKSGIFCSFHVPQDYPTQLEPYATIQIVQHVLHHFLAHAKIYFTDSMPDAHSPKIETILHIEALNDATKHTLRIYSPLLRNELLHSLQQSIVNQAASLEQKVTVALGERNEFMDVHILHHELA